MDFAAEGLLDGLEGERARADRIALLEELLADGVPPEELKAAVAEDRLVFLRVERLGPDVGERELSARFAAINEHLGPQLGETMRRIFEMHLQDQLRNDAIGRAEIVHGRIPGASEV